MTTQQLIRAIREEFLKEVEKKNSWGKEQLKQLFEKIISDAILKFLND